jgi:hypothetical protein
MKGEGTMSENDNDEAALMRRALIDELAREVSDGEGNLVVQRELIARALVTMGATCNVAALRELLNRIIGRVPQAAKAKEEPRRLIVRWQGSAGPTPDEPTMPPAP